MAELGLQYAHDPYDRERYERILVLSTELRVCANGWTEIDLSHALSVLHDPELKHVSPHAAADSVVFRDDMVLLIRRDDNGLWALPGGLAEVGLGVTASARKELREETGVDGRPIQLCAFLDTSLHDPQARFHYYTAMYEFDIGSQTPIAGPETLDVGFFGEDQLPPLDPGHTFKVQLVFEQRRRQAPLPFIDPPPLTSAEGGSEQPESGLRTMLGSTVTVEIDRPLGTLHPDHGFCYPVNYGFVPGTQAADGEPIDAYLLGRFEPVHHATGRVIAVIERRDDDDDKLVVADRCYAVPEIRTLVEFQERFFDSTIIPAAP